MKEILKMKELTLMIVNSNIKNRGGMIMKQVELAIPIIYDGQKQIGYGGNQEWFKTKWARKAGCASVCAANMTGYYLFNKQVFSKDEFLLLMEEMYSIMEPKKRGFPYSYLYKYRLRKYLNNNNKPIEAKIYRRFSSIQEAIRLVKEGINSNHPIALLILYHHHPDLEEDNWHWVCITGYLEKDNQTWIIFSDCGERKVIAASILFEVHADNIMKMVVFKSQ